MNVSEAIPAARATLEAIVGRTGSLFGGEANVYRATLSLDSDAPIPGRTQLLKAGQTRDLIVKISSAGDVPWVCLKFPDAYGPGRDQDFLLASSGDGAPLHHVTLPAAAPTLYSSLWLYLAGISPVLFGIRTDGSELGDGAVAEFCVSAPVGKFHRIGTITVGARVDDADPTFAGRNTGGNIRALPPVSLY